MWMIRLFQFSVQLSIHFPFAIQDFKNRLEEEGGTFCLKPLSGGGELKARNTTQIPCATLTDFTPI